jgi:formylglycine-generating enzyme required for sulfatase activity
MTHQVLSRSLLLASLTLFTACTPPDRPNGSGGGAGGSSGADASGGAGKSGSGSSGAGKSGSSGAGGSSAGQDGGASGDTSGPDSAGAGGDDTAPLDPCVGVTCDAPPAAGCNSATEYQTYDGLGSCSKGDCSYAKHVIACTCKSDACTTDPCVTVTCDTPPVAKCADANKLTEYAASGTCDAGSCSYQASDKTCEFGCAAGACKTDPCAGMTCSTPPTTKCKDGNTKTTYAASGTCSAGKCSYAATDADCPSNQACSGQGACAVCKTDASCGATCAACSGSTPKCKAQSTTSACVGCLSNADCSGATPVCNTSTNACQARPSCIGLAKTCGPNSNQDCCASGLVTGGTFNRGNDPAYPATVSNFRLDNYEVTVGRFRKFVAAYSPDMIASGAGKNPNNASDPGWNTAWNGSLPADADTLKAWVRRDACMDASAPTWTDNAQTAATESVPINCITWYSAEAFCIWDGGRLPTEAEWNYAAAGGTAQRNYPWGGAAPDCNYANFSGCTTGYPHFRQVGSQSPKGDGVWGQSDLAGNIMEWVQDYYAASYPTPCNNCSNLTAADRRVTRSGYYDAESMLTSARNNLTPSSDPFDYMGIRCARAP